MRRIREHASPGPTLLAVVVVSAVVGLVLGASAAYAIYYRLGPVQRIVSAPSSSGTTGPTVGSIATAARQSVVEILTQQLPTDSLRGTPTGIVNGFVVSADGLVATSLPGVEGGTRLRIGTQDGHAYDATIAGSDAAHGVVLLQAVGAHGLTPLRFASSPAHAGDLAVIAASPPLGGLAAVTTDVISAGRPATVGRGRVVDDTVAVGAISDPGLEGAPILDGTGSVIGVATLPDTTSAGSRTVIGLSGAALARLSDRVSQGLRPGEGTLELGTVPLDAATAALAGLPPGIFVRSVQVAGPAANAGIEPGDIVTAVNGSPVDADHPLDITALGLDSGQRIRLSVWRGGQLRTVDVVVG